MFEPRFVGTCRAQLMPFRCPAMVRFVPRLDLTAGGKLARAQMDKAISRNVLLTGGSRVVGFAIVRMRLAAEGWRVFALARKDQPKLCARNQEPSAPAGRSISFSYRSWRSLEGIPALVRELKAEHGPVYGLVNNAALGTEGLLSNMHNSDIEALVRINTLAPIILTKYVSRAMMTAGEGRIVTIASIIASTGYSGLSVYGATKASMLGFTRSLAREVGRLGVTVNAIAPGFMDTDMTQGLDAAQRGKIASRSALKRLADVGDVANMVAFLLGEGGKNITGAVMTIDAGNTA